MTHPTVTIGLNEIGKNVWTRTTALTQALESEAPPATLYHYTAQMAAYSILKQGELWATHTEYLNDSKEQRHIQEPLEGAWKRLRFCAANPAERMALQLMEPGVLGAISPTEDNGIAGPVDSGNTYIACFCPNGDMLSQWRGYGATGPAYALGFDSTRLAELRPLVSKPESPKKPAFSTQLVKVEYRLEEQVATLHALIKGVMADVMKLLQKSGDTPNDYALGLVSLGVRLRWYILRTFAARYKDEGFDQEDEWRLVTRSYSPDTPLEAVDFRPTTLGMAPYVKLRNITWSTDSVSQTCTAEVEKCQLPIAEVTQGPIENAGPGLRSMDMMLRKWNYKHKERPVEVEKSTIPYRPT